MQTIRKPWKPPPLLPGAPAFLPSQKLFASRHPWAKPAPWTSSIPPLRAEASTHQEADACFALDMAERSEESFYR